ncbi:PEP-CTERM protein-sorting domain-containing protein [Nitrosomonas oligotropha]|uniref:PEP-CTERM protein-sorting domain-containing protein n=2 Tax=Nitrosomonas oligotropha TaxID=42354 RepID=A0A1H8QL28_9PROT|nr:PEP-CTERM protein-sorting domain-containing protein [Nitrosomonas oligotropha]SEO54647.1 PEP-CTERM protein-sorting domain-containing protein [Nitrosomonas oligotropha]
MIIKNMNKLLFIAALSVSVNASAEWSIIGLGTLGGISSTATGINDSGQVSGTYRSNDGKSHAFSTGANGIGAFDLGTLGGSLSVAEDINNSGKVTGASYITGDALWAIDVPAFHAYLTGENGIGMNDLGGPLSYGMDVNNSGVVVGQSAFDSKYVHGFITANNGSDMKDMGTLGGNQSSALGVNDSGQVVGWSSISTKNDIYHAFITGADGNGMIDLGTLGGESSVATDINSSGQTVGSSDDAFGNTRAFVTGPNGFGMTDLGTFGGISSWATGINDAGQVVGSAYTPGTEIHAFVFNNGVMVDLSLLEPIVSAGWTNLQATEINNFGQIVGEGTLNGVRQGFLISGADQEDFYLTYVPPKYDTPTTSIPEPSTYVMLLAGLGLVGFSLKHQTKSSRVNA